MNNLLLLLATLHVFSKNMLEQMQQLSHNRAPEIPVAPPPPPPPTEPPAQLPHASVPTHKKQPPTIPIGSLNGVEKKLLTNKIENLATDLADFKSAKDEFDTEFVAVSDDIQGLETLKADVNRILKKYKEHRNLLDPYAFDKKDALYQQLATNEAQLKGFLEKISQTIKLLQTQSETPVIPSGEIPSAPPLPGNLSTIKPKGPLESVKPVSEIKTKPATKPAKPALPAPEDIITAAGKLKSSAARQQNPSVQEFETKFNAVQENLFKKPTEPEKAAAQKILNELKENIEISTGSDKESKIQLYTKMLAKFGS